MPTQELTGTTALVTGASRGFGRGVAIALFPGGCPRRRNRP
jgi:NAD(P)-dependent dehydrogenase (short-subunit alcohol dehydrogenase family)